MNLAVGSMVVFKSLSDLSREQVYPCGNEPVRNTGARCYREDDPRPLPDPAPDRLAPLPLVGYPVSDALGPGSRRVVSHVLAFVRTREAPDALYSDLVAALAAPADLVLPLDASLIVPFLLALPVTVAG